MEIKKIILTYKKSILQLYSTKNKKSLFSKLLDENDITIQTLKESHIEHTKSLDTIINTLDKTGINVSIVTKGKSFDEKDYDLVLTAGGDGTFLETSHNVFTKPILGINTSPSYSVGYYCGADADNLKFKLDQLQEGKLSVSKLMRLTFKVNNSDYAVQVLNDVLFAGTSPADSCYYLLQVDDLMEDQVSSGIWISTPSGSQAGIYSAGGTAQDINDDKFQFVVREPFVLNRKVHLKKGFANSSQIIKIYSKSLNNCLFIDGSCEKVSLKYGDRVEILPSNLPLSVYGLEDM